MPELTIGKKYKVVCNGKVKSLKLIRSDLLIDKITGFGERVYYFELGKKLVKITPLFLAR